MTSNTEAYLALAGTLFGGAGFKVLENFLARNKNRVDQDKSMRDELRTEVQSLRVEAEKLKEESDHLREEIDFWRSRYYSLVASVAHGDNKGALKKIEDDEKSS